jgi:uncharacterized protein (TIGR00255 family)
MTLPDVFVQERTELSESDESTILEAIVRVLKKLDGVRTEEGKRLQKDLEKRFAVCHDRISKIEKHFDRLMIEKKNLIDRQLSSIQAGDEMAKVQAEDLYASVNKMDIHEEITRFNSHLTSVTQLFRDKKQPDKGKRLDFILQELLREINTLMAKCASFDISSLAIDVKVELEKAREQVQNIV